MREIDRHAAEVQGASWRAGGREGGAAHRVLKNKSISGMKTENLLYC